MRPTTEELLTLPQGDLRLLGSETAERLLASTELARLAYVVADGTPRVMPMMFHWTGDELVFSTFAGAHKIAALRARPDVAVTIDTPGPPPQVLQLRGRATATEVDGIVPEYALAHHRYYGPDQGARTSRPSTTPVRGWLASPCARAGWAFSTSPRAFLAPSPSGVDHEDLCPDSRRRRPGLVLAPAGPRAARAGTRDSGPRHADAR
ncbi:pyridoxamine 5'-phosphate oxidase family protein [Streptacidiphilus sp. MAP12-20]|uniref:pyridoxamine 5'-phosphate oxidase family protein n=1 Tax=Streptacidiphilus sp. MAP12-20 TaxID=3156299 RepID=UPI0035136849